LTLRRTRSNFNLTASGSIGDMVSCADTGAFDPRPAPHRSRNRLRSRLWPLRHAISPPLGHQLPCFNTSSSFITDLTPRCSGRFLVGIHRAERASPVLPVGPIPGTAPDCGLSWPSPWFRTSAIARLWKISLPELQGGLIRIVGRPFCA